MADNDPTRRAATELNAAAVNHWRALLDAYRAEYQRRGHEPGGEDLFARTLMVYWKNADRTPTESQQMRFDKLAHDAREDDTIMRGLWPQDLVAWWVFTMRKVTTDGMFEMYLFQPGILIAVAQSVQAKAMSLRTVFKVDYLSTEGSPHWQALNAMMAITGRIVAYGKTSMTTRPYFGVLFLDMHMTPLSGLDPDIGPVENLRRIRLLLPHMIVGQYNDMGDRMPPVL